MTTPPYQTGKAPFKIPSIEEPCFTFYKIFGNLSSDKPPVIIAHGGPGAGHEYLLPFSDLWQDYELPVIFYDQIGCASSTHLRRLAGDRSFWREKLFQDELDNLIAHLGLRQFSLLGQSWGGMLAAAFGSRRPQGLQRLVLASALASRELGEKGVQLVKNQWPKEWQEAIEEAESKKDYSSPIYEAASDYYRRNYVCRVDPFPPPEMLPSLQHISQDSTVYHTMRGPSPLISDGSLDDWTVIPRLSNIAVPTLVYNGEFDTSRDIAQIPFFELIPKVRWITFAGAGHMCHLEGKDQRQRILKIVGEFLTQ